MLNEQASEKQTSKNVFMSLNKNIAEFCMNNTLLTIEQDEKQFSIFSNTVSTIISINHTTIITINKTSKKDTATYTAKLWITTNFIDHKMIITDYEASKKALTINIVES